MSRRTYAIWRLLLIAQLREQPARFLVTVLALALGVSLGFAVYLVNTSALNEFGLATKRLVGEADVVIRGSREGFAEQLFVDLARNPAVSAASPVLELEAALPARSQTLKVLGLDPLRAAVLQPALIGDIGEAMFQLFEPDTIYLSASAAQALNLRSGDTLNVTVGSNFKTLRVLGVLSEGTYPGALGLMDIASAQWAFDSLGRLNRIDLRLVPGTDVEAFRKNLGTKLPAGVLAITPKVERDRAVSVTRAYRVNVNMLALVALFTGAFLVFSTQSLSVLRRRRSLALLRALGVTRGELRLALLGEGVTLGLIGSLLGVLLGALMAAATLRFLTADLGNGQLRAMGASLLAVPWQTLAFMAVGTCVAATGCLGARAQRRSSNAGARAEGRRRRFQRGRYSRLALGTGADSARYRSRVAAARGRLADLRLWRDRYAAVRCCVVGAGRHGAGAGHCTAHRAHRLGYRGCATARERRAFRTQLGIHHREFQFDGGDGHHGLFLSRVVRSLVDQAAAG